MMKKGGVDEDQLARCYIHHSTHKLFLCINKYVKILRGKVQKISTCCYPQPKSLTLDLSESFSSSLKKSDSRNKRGAKIPD